VHFCTILHGYSCCCWRGYFQRETFCRQTCTAFLLDHRWSHCQPFCSSRLYRFFFSFVNFSDTCVEQVRRKFASFFIYKQISESFTWLRRRSGINVLFVDGDDRARFHLMGFAVTASFRPFFPASAPPPALLPSQFCLIDQKRVLYWLFYKCWDVISKTRLRQLSLTIGLMNIVKLHRHEVQPFFLLMSLRPSPQWRTDLATIFII